MHGAQGRSGVYVVENWGVALASAFPAKDDT